MIKVPSAKIIADRYVKYGSQRADRYDEGVRNPGADWEKETVAAEDNYEKGVTAGISRKAFSKGVKQCGTARQQEKSITKGIRNWATGLSEAGPDMEKAMEKVVAVLERIKLPPRFSKGDPRNYDRVKAVGTALREAKEKGEF